MSGYVMFAGLLGLLTGFVLMKLAIGSTIEAWKARCLEAERQRDNFKQSADERGAFNEYLLKQKHAEVEEWPDEISA